VTNNPSDDTGHLLQFPTGPTGPKGEKDQTFQALIGQWIATKTSQMLLAQAVCPEFGIALLADLIHTASIVQADIASLSHLTRPHEHTAASVPVPQPEDPPFPEAT